MPDKEPGSAATAARLLDAARAAVLSHGLSDASARIIAASAGAAPSAINYNFGGLERLFAAVFEAEHAAVEAWASQMAEAFADLPKGVVGATAGLLHAVRTWTGDRRRALLYAEARARLSLERDLGPAHARRMRAVFDALADAVGFDPPAGALLHAFFEMQALLHLSRWRPALEEAALAELAERFVSVWLALDPTPKPCPAYAQALRLGARAPGELSPAAMRFAEAAVAVVGRLGLHGLTHRAVAAEIGVTAGAVAHYFRTWEDLLAGALRGQVEQLLSVEGAREPPSRAAFIEGYVARAEDPTPPGPVTARQDLFLAALRRPELAVAGAAIRYAHGGTAMRLLGPRLLERADAAPISALTSLLLTALWRVCAAAPDPTRERADLAATIAARAPL